MDKTTTDRTPQVIELFAAGDGLVARCTLCGGQLRRSTPPPPNRHWDGHVAPGWLLCDLLDAMGQHVRGNHS